MKSNYMLFGFLLLNLLLMIFVAGCGSLGEPSEIALISLSSDKVSIPANGKSSVALNAIVRDASGSVVTDETLVTFRTSLGVFSNGLQDYTVKTFEDSGSVSVSLISDDVPGLAEISCTSGNIIQYISVMFTGDGPDGETAWILLSSENMTLPADENSSTSIQATLYDASGQPVKQGTPVIFTTSLGTFLNKEKEYSVTTLDESGIVGVSLIASKVSGTAEVVAVSNEVSQKIDIVFAGPIQKTISLTASPNELFANGSNRSVLTATVRDNNGELVDNEPVEFTIVSGDGRFLDGKRVEYTSSGIANVEYVASSSSGEVIILARLRNESVFGEVKILLIDAGLGSISLTLSEESLPADGKSSTTITATLIDNTGNPVPKGTKVDFQTNLGKFLNNSTTDTVETLDDSGVVLVSLIASTIGGKADVICSSGGLTQLVSINFIYEDDSSLPDLNDVNIKIDLKDQETGQIITTIKADSPGELYIYLTDKNNNPITNKFVQVETTKGVLNPPDGTVITNNNGFAVISILAGNDLGAGLVTATVDGYSNQIAFQIGAANIRMGSIINGNFVEGVLLASISESQQLAPGGTATFEVVLVDSKGDLYTSPVDVNFSSVCASSGSAFIDETKTTVNGKAIATYRADGCIGLDTITASANVGGISPVATTVIEVAESQTGSIEYISSNPSTIVLAGTGAVGRSETSTVIFRVVDQTGNPAPNKIVNFSLSTHVGGLLIAPLSAQSDRDGFVRTVVRSGRVHTSVRVIAQVVDTEIMTSSDELVISTGLPDQNSFSISADVLNPEAWHIDGELVNFTLRAADHFNNPVPDGTAITFETEGASIGSSCTTVNGSCSVEWYSHDPKPSDGRVTIIASAIGEESFIDVNGNGIYDESDLQYWDINNFDLSEAFRDDNENGIFDFGFEEPLNYDADDIFNSDANGIYNGTLCSDSSELICTRDLLYVRDSLVLVMSGSHANISFSPDSVDLRTSAGVVSQRVVITLADLHNQPIPYNSEVSLTTSNGVLVGEASFNIPNTNVNSPLTYSVFIEREEEPNTKVSGIFQVKVVTPHEVVSVASIPVIDDPPPEQGADL